MDQDGEHEPDRVVCLVHPGRSVVTICRTCRRALCMSCLHAGTPYCSDYCLRRAVTLPILAKPGGAWAVLGLFALGVAAAAALAAALY